MSQEGQLLDKKSLRSVTGKTVNWSELAKDCVAFANAYGGRLLIGIEDAEDLPPHGQRIPSDLPDIIRRTIAERTVNVTLLQHIIATPSSDEYIDIGIPRSSTGHATQRQSDLAQNAPYLQQLSQTKRQKYSLTN
ncbi:MAG: putative DNA binding domain-containing protein [Massilia sp.]|nr:putative DNA binding domain-containing protein [Massilia sp.]